MKLFSTINNENLEKETSKTDVVKYIVLMRYVGLEYWSVIHESRKGVSILDAEAIYNYQIEFCEKMPNDLMIIPVPERNKSTLLYRHY